MIRVVTGAAVLAVVLTAAGCSRTAAAGRVRAAPKRASATSPALSKPSRRSMSVANPLRPWRGPVEELFVHPLVINPRLAFTADPLGVGLQQNFVTALEFRRILDQLWRKGWTLVDVHRAAQGAVRVPEGRRPLVLSEDDVNYYQYFTGRGLADRLVLQGGRVEAELPGGRLTDDDVVPLVDAEVARHPEFSADGAKGVLAVTGYEGIFGEHQPHQPAARQRLKALAHWLTGHGWTIASHTWGHIDLSNSSPSAVAWTPRNGRPWPNRSSAIPTSWSTPSARGHPRRKSSNWSTPGIGFSSTSMWLLAGAFGRGNRHEPPARGRIRLRRAATTGPVLRRRYRPRSRSTKLTRPAQKAPPTSAGSN